MRRPPGSRRDSDRFMPEHHEESHKSANTGSAGSLANIALWISLLGLAILPFLPGANGEFIEDDLLIIRDNERLRELRDLPGIFGETYWGEQGQGGLYRPLTVASYALDRVVWGEEPLPGEAEGAPRPPLAGGIHRTNLILNFLAAALVFLILRQRCGAGWAAWVGAALFAAHPVHVEPVVHLVGRADVLMTVLLLGAFHLHGKPGIVARLGALVLFLGALLSKEMAVALPALLLVDHWLDRRKGKLKSFLVKQLRELWPYLLVFVIFLGIRGIVLGGSMDPPRFFALYVPGQYVAFQDPAPGEVTLTMLHAFGEYLLLLVAPIWLSADYSGFPHATTPGLPVVLSSLALGVWVVFCLLRFRKGQRKPTFWLLWFALTLVPVSNLIVVSGIVMAERALYLPSVAACGMAALAVSWLERRGRVWLLLPLVLILLLAVRSATRAPVWRDPRTLFEDTVANGRHRGHIALSGLVGEYLKVIDEQPELVSTALPLAEESVRLNMTWINMHYLADLLERAGRLDESLRWWEALRGQQPERADFRAKVLSVLARLAATRERAGDLKGAIESTVRGWQFVRQQGSLAERQRWSELFDQRYEKYVSEAVTSGDAIATLERVLGLQQFAPDHPLVKRHKATAVAGAIAEFRRRIGDAERRGQWNVALDACAGLERLDPRDPVMLRGLESAMIALSTAGQENVAEQIARKLLSLDPTNEAALRVAGGSDPVVPERDP